MERDHIFLLVALVCVANGLFSPWVLVAVVNAPAWMPGFIPYVPSLLFYGASLMVATFTLLLSGVPAALAERLFRDQISPEGALWIWLVAALGLSLPAIEALLARS